MGQSRLFSPLTVGNMNLTHRMGLCPLTRYRASDEHVPLDIMVDYYAQRSSVPGTLLVTEGTFISVEDGGYANAPGIYNQEQIDMWRKITDAVHANGSYIFCQLWALGRAADVEVTKREGTTIFSSDAVAINSNFSPPQRLSVTQIQTRIQNYVSAALNAVDAGFDGVELHGANGYLIDQFIQDKCNKREDDYGGSLENRSRFAVEVTQAVCEAIGPEKTGIRLSPWSTFNGMRMDDPIPQFSDVIRKISKLNLAYIHLVDARIAGSDDVEASDKLTFAYDLWDGPILVAGGLKPSTARALLDQEHPKKNIIAMFGRYFLSTPDLPFRVEEGLELNSYKRETFYTPKSAIGYSDYPFSKEYLVKN